MALDEVIPCDQPVASCPVCAGACDPYSIDLVRCRGCATTYRARRPSPAAAVELYARGMHYANWATEQEERQRLWLVRAALVRRFRSGGTLLDVGTGDGAFAAMMARSGFSVTATEVSPRGAALASGRGVHVILGELKDCRLSRASFDVVTLWHVLEHVYDPIALMREVRELLSPGGIAIVAVPNELRTLYRARIDPDYRVGLLTSDEYELHLTFFTPETLRELLRRAGFQEIEFGVDDVTVRPNALTRAAARMNTLLSGLARLNFSRAMFFVCRAAGAPA